MATPSRSIARPRSGPGAAPRFNLGRDPARAREFHDEARPKEGHELGHSGSMKITCDVRDHAEATCIADGGAAPAAGLEAKAAEFKKAGSKIHHA